MAVVVSEIGRRIVALDCTIFRRKIGVDGMPRLVLLVMDLLMTLDSPRRELSDT